MITRGLLRAACLLWACLAAGCVTMRTHIPYDPPGGAPTRVALEAPTPFDYERAPPAIANHDLPERDSRHYRVKQLQFPSAGDSGQPGNLVTAMYYKSRAPGRKKLVVVLPIWGSYTYPSDVIADGIRSRAGGDTNVLMVLGENYLVDWEGMGAAPTRRPSFPAPRPWPDASKPP